MKNKNLSDTDLLRILDIARNAPSVHNSQPWKVRLLDNHLVEISIDSTRALKAGDPTGRQTFISLGIFTEAFCVAARSVGKQLSNPELSDQKVALELKNNLYTSKKNDHLVKALVNRCSDRSVYKPVEISDKVMKTIKASWKSKNSIIHIINEQNFIEKLAGLTARGINLALANPLFRQELTNYLLTPWSRRKIGIAAKSLNVPVLMAMVEPQMLKFGLNLAKESALEKRRWSSASAVILITTNGDLHKDWFEAGRAYLRVSLSIEMFSLSQATSAAVVEAATYHEDIEESLDTKQRLQAVIRIGKGNPKKHFSPRLDPENLITST